MNSKTRTNTIKKINITTYKKLMNKTNLTNIKINIDLKMALSSPPSKSKTSY